MMGLQDTGLTLAARGCGPAMLICSGQDMADANWLGCQSAVGERALLTGPDAYLRI